MNLSMMDMNTPESNRTFSLNQSKFDVLKLYEDPQFENQFSIFRGGLDTGIDLGKFMIDTRNYLTDPIGDDPDS